MKLVRNASSFAVTQYGVATFRYLKDQRKCVAPRGACARVWSISADRGRGAV